jgi:hypothetical protein
MTATQDEVFIPIADPTRRITAEDIKHGHAPYEFGAANKQLLNPAALTLADLPPQWEQVPDMILAQLAPQAVREVRGPLGRSYLVDMTGVITPEQKKAIDSVARSRWFVMRNDGPVMQRARCGRCGGVHQYLTLGCVERPFHGLQEIVGLVETYAAEGKHVERVLQSIRLGAIVPITRKQARQLADKIRAKGIRFYESHQIEGG